MWLRPDMKENNAKKQNRRPWNHSKGEGGCLYLCILSVLRYKSRPHTLPGSGCRKGELLIQGLEGFAWGVENAWSFQNKSFAPGFVFLAQTCRVTANPYIYGGEMASL